MLIPDAMHPDVIARQSIEARTRALDIIIDEAASSPDIVGLAVAVVRGGETAFVKTAGPLAVGAPAQVTPQTRFRIASLSKAFAATLALQLVEEGKLSLSDRARQFAPAFQLKRAGQADAATLEHVLSHRLGLPPYAYDNLLEAGRSPETLLRKFKEVDPICPVGRCYAYQNVGFNMIASAIENIDQRPFGAALSARIFDPLGMEDASVGKASLTIDDNWARSHKRRKDAPWRVVAVKQPYYDIPAAGGVNASIEDMAIWLAANLGHHREIISPETSAQLRMSRVDTPAEFRRLRLMPAVTKAQYGLGWRIYDYGGHKLVTHAGSVEGYSAQIAFLPERDVGIVLLTNARSKAFWEILPQFINLELGIDAPVKEF